MIVKNVKIVDTKRIFDGSVEIRNGKIAEVFDGFSPVTDGEVIDGEGLYLSSGFIDLHIHGGGSFSAMGSEDEIVKMCDAHLSHGTTSILPTTLAAPVDTLIKTAENINGAKKKSAANILGVHFEGPFLSKKMCGAQNGKSLLIPAKTDYQRLIDVDSLRMMGVAPELDGSDTLVKKLNEKGVVVSLAHTEADFDLTQKAFENGFSDFTHIFCACSKYEKDGVSRSAGAAEAGLVSDCTVQVIADLKHLPVGILKLIYSCKGSERMYLITDGLEFSACETENGQTVIQKNGVKAVVENGVMLTADKKKIAGSIATMDILVRNMYKSVGVPLNEAITMATATPARVIGEKKKGSVKKGFDADLLLFDDDINIKAVFVNGKRVK